MLSFGFEGQKNTAFIGRWILGRNVVTPKIALLLLINLAAFPESTGDLGAPAGTGDTGRSAQDISGTGETGRSA